jgi:hypothetical protein
MKGCLHVGGRNQENGIVDAYISYFSEEWNEVVS